MKTTRNISMHTSNARGVQSTALGGKKDFANNAEGNQSFAEGLSCQATGEGSIAMGIEAAAYQRASVSIGKACVSGLTQEEFNDKFATDEQKALEGYDATKLNGGLNIQILDNHNKTYDISESFSFATGVKNKSWDYGAFVSGSQNKSYAKNSFVSGDTNTNNGERALVFGMLNDNDNNDSILLGTKLSLPKDDPNNHIARVVVGQCNDDSAIGTYFMVGTGQTENSRQNDLEVRRGSVRIPNRLYLVGDIESSNPKSGVNVGYVQSKFNELNLQNAPNKSVKLNFQENVIDNSVGAFVLGYNNLIKTSKWSAILSGESNSIESTTDAVGGNIILNGHSNKIKHGSNNLVAGQGNEAVANEQAIFGLYANGDPNAIFQVGCGTSTDRNDALTISKKGNVLLNLDIGKNSGNTLPYLDNSAVKYRDCATYFTNKIQNDRSDLGITVTVTNYTLHTAGDYPGTWWVTFHLSIETEKGSYIYNDDYRTTTVSQNIGFVDLTLEANKDSGFDSFNIHVTGGSESYLNIGTFRGTSLGTKQTLTFTPDKFPGGNVNDIFTKCIFSGTSFSLDDFTPDSNKISIFRDSLFQNNLMTNIFNETRTTESGKILNGYSYTITATIFEKSKFY